MSATAAEAGPSGRADCYVIVYNISKKHNIGTLLRSCTAFGVKEVSEVPPAATLFVYCWPIQNASSALEERFAVIVRA
jgi:hypothetical protein